ncbi:hypothetical protein BDV18DRAFT_64784 [Aspergillus unguis]
MARSIICQQSRPRLRGIGCLRRHKIIRDNIKGITRPAIRRLARRGGVYRIKKEIYDEIRVVTKERLTEIIRNVVLILDSATVPSRERKLVTTMDVVYALKRMGQTVYGFDAVHSRRGD